MVHQARINVDKLHVSYEVNELLAQKLASSSKGDKLFFDGYELGVTNKKGDTIYADLTCMEEKYGKFVFNKDSIVFEYENQTLYTVFGVNSNGRKDSLQIVGEEIMGNLGLQPLKVTKLELAIDCNKCPQLRALIADCKNYDMVYNGRKLKDNEDIPNYMEYNGRTRKAVERNPTICFGQAKKDGIRFKLYDKAREIAQASGKEYIADWNEFKGGIYRLEVSIGSKQWKEWLEYTHNHLSDYYALQPNETMEEYNGRNVWLLSVDEAYKVSLYNWLANRVLYFTDKKTKEKISLIDLCTGWMKPQKRSNKPRKPKL